MSKMNWRRVHFENRIREHGAARARAPAGTALGDDELRARLRRRFGKKAGDRAYFQIKTAREAKAPPRQQQQQQQAMQKRVVIPGAGDEDRTNLERWLGKQSAERPDDDTSGPPGE
jgi:hypothetical protein